MKIQFNSVKIFPHYYAKNKRNDNNATVLHDFLQGNISITIPNYILIDINNEKYKYLTNTNRTYSIIFNKIKNKNLTLRKYT